jgi:hypothetical protein
MAGKQNGNTSAAAVQAAAGCPYLNRGWGWSRAWQRLCSDAGVVAAWRPEKVVEARKRCAMAQKNHGHGVGEWDCSSTSAPHAWTGIIAPSSSGW